MITSCHTQGAKSLTDRWAEEFSDLAGLEGQTDTDFWNKLQEHWQEADRWCTLSLWPSVVTMHLFVSVTQVVWTAISPTPVHTATHASAVLPAIPAVPLPLCHVIKKEVFFFFVLHHPHGKFWSPYLVRHSSRKSSATYSCQQWYGCQCLGFLTCAQMLMHVIAHGGCTDTIRESALHVDSGTKIPCCTRDSNPPQYCTWPLSRALYQLSYLCPVYYSRK